ncbi:MAG TPA: NAD(P)H-hydrate dehydratase [Verrucomicrobiae bacterium]|nr:NAD(P)H-hydrate dehydratase [Verrucomicrobiae bacterium]
MRILTRNEVQEAEREATGRTGMSALVLMQRAGSAVAQFCVSHFKFSSVCVVCGRSKSSGYGMAAAEALRELAATVSVIILAGEATELTDDTAAMCSRLSAEPIFVADEAGLDDNAVRDALGADLIVDAIAGGDFAPLLEGLARKAVEAVNDAFGTVVSVDLPSGIDPDSKAPAHESGVDAVFAHGIITFIAPKPAHVFGELTSGPIAVSEIGVQPALAAHSTGLSVITGQEVGITFPPRLSDAHKGDFGHVLVIAGSRGKAGVAALAGMAALRAGAGLVTVACPKSIQATVAGFAPELMTEGLAETPDGTIAMDAAGQLESLTTGKDVIVLGSGLSRNPETAGFVRHLVARCSLPLVLDGDGLNAFEGHYHELKRGSEAAPFRVLILHPGEAARLFGVATDDVHADSLEVARRLARETGCCVVLKGRRTVVAGASTETWVNMTGNSALAKGGADEVLAGIAGAALTRRSGSLLRVGDVAGAREPDSGADLAAEQHANPGQASAFLKDVKVAAAVYLHGLAADFARDMLHENTVLASDLLDTLTEAFRDGDLQMDQRLFYLQK